MQGAGHHLSWADSHVNSATHRDLAKRVTRPADPSRRGLLRKASAAASASLLGVALPQAASAFERGRLSVWYDYNGGAGMRRVAQRFGQATGMGVTVEGPEDLPTRFRRAASAGKGPDVFAYAHDQVGEWTGGGLLRPVTPSVSALADLNPMGLKAFTSGGRLWGYPLNIQAVHLVYNKALVSTPPTTWDEVFALDRELVKHGRKAILWDYSNGYFTWPLLAAHGGFTFEQGADGRFDATRCGIDHPGAVKGLELVARLVREGLMPAGAGYADMEAAIAKGQVAMMINGPWSWVKLRKAGIDVGAARLPMLDGRRPVPMVGVTGVMINRASPHRELATEFIERHMLTLPGLRALNDDEPIGVPGSLAFYDELKADTKLATVMASAQDGLPMPSIPEMGKFFAALKTAIDNVTQGRQTPREALALAAQRVAQRAAGK